MAPCAQSSSPPYAAASVSLSYEESNGSRHMASVYVYELYYLGLTRGTKSNANYTVSPLPPCDEGARGPRV